LNVKEGYDSEEDEGEEEEDCRGKNAGNHHEDYNSYDE
jgi:hypothetical protein